MLNTHSVLNQAKELQEYAVSLRRQLHAHPELSFAEHQTAALVAERLQQLGYSVRKGVGGTGVTADLGQGTTVAIRAELDALPVPELNRSLYSSQVAGVSHACGHDANMACALTAARLLSEIRPGGRVRIIMQPAAEQAVDESGRTGTQAMIADGARQDVQAIIGVHVDTTLPAGKVGSLLEPDLVSTQSFEITMHSREGTKRPTESTDIILRASRLVQELYEKAGALDSTGTQPLTVNSIHSASVHGDGPGDSLVIQGVVRAASKESRSIITRALDRICAACNGDWNDCSIAYAAAASPHASSREIAEIMRQSACELLGADCVLSLKRKTWTEDFAGFTEVVPGALMLLGAGIAGHRHIAHSPTFDIDESGLHVGAAVLAQAACRLLEHLNK